MTLPRTGLNDVFTPTTNVSATEIEFIHRWIETQGIGALLAIGGGAISGFEVTDDGGLGIAIAPGIAIAESSTYGAVLLQRTLGGSLTLDADGTSYIFASIEVSGSNDSRQTALPLFVADDTNAIDGAVLLAKVITGASSITSILDMRPLLDSADSTTNFAYDDSNSDGLDFGYTAGRIRLNDGTVQEVAAGTVALTDATTNYVEIDDTGTVVANTSGWNADNKPIAQTTTAGGDITDVDDKRVSFDFGAGGGAGTVTTVTGSDGVTSSGGDTPELTLTDGGVTDAKIGNRTVDDTLATPASTGTLTQLLSWIAGQLKALSGETAWTAAPDTTLADAALHIADAAPHTGQLNTDGSNSMLADLDLGGNKIVNGAAGVNPTDFPIMSQLDAVAAGYVDLPTAKAMSTTNLTLSGTQTVDGVAAGVNDRVFLSGQTTQSENGPWLVQAGAWTRPADFDTGDTPSAGTRIFIEFGTARKGTSWTLLTVGATVDTDPLEWTQTGANSTGEANTTSNAGSGTGQLAKAKAGVDLPIKTLAAGSTKLGITNNTNDVTLDVVEANIVINNLSGTLGPTKGGTGLTSFVVGDMLYASGVNVLAKLAGNPATTRTMLFSIGTGSAANPPVWGVLLGNDIPAFGPSGPAHSPGGLTTPGATRYSYRRYPDDWGGWSVPTAVISATSPTNFTIPASTGVSKTFNVGTGWSFAVGQYIRAVSAADNSNMVAGYVTAYTGGNLTFDVYEFSGSGIYGDFTVSLSAPAGPGVPIGGTTGQVLAKIDATDYNTQWTDPATGSGDMLKATYDSDADGIIDIAAIPDIASTKISDSTTAGRALLTAADVAAQVTALGAQTTANLSSSIATDTGSTTKYPSVAAVETAIAAGGGGSASLNDQTRLWMRYYG